MQEKFGLCQWIHLEDEKVLGQTIKMCEDLGITHLRTGISWADYESKNGEEWQDHVIDTLHRARLKLLLTVCYTPPSKSLNGKHNGIPKQLTDFQYMIACLKKYKGKIEGVELWNEPNNYAFWDIEADPGLEICADMLYLGAKQLREDFGDQIKIVLGGIVPVNHGDLEPFKRRGVFEFIDAVSIHTFYGMPWNQENDKLGQTDWEQTIPYISEYLDGKELWVTETGFSSLLSKEEQVERLKAAITMTQANNQVSRTYWYSTIDLCEERSCIAFDAGQSPPPEHYLHEYCMGLSTINGELKPAYYALREALKSA